MSDTVLIDISVEGNKNETKGTENATKNHSWLLYGSYGYTGQLIVDLAVKRKLKEIEQGITNGLPLPILSGRNEYQIGKIIHKYKQLLPRSSQFVTRIFSLDDHELIKKGLEGVAVVVNCAGPYEYTCKPLVEACLSTRTHYTDVSGEWNTIEYVMSKAVEASLADVVLIPGIGFDILATDCLSAFLSAQLPGATHMELGISGLDNMSRGTIKSGIELLAQGGKIREEGTIKTVPFFYKDKEIQYPSGLQYSISVPMGDVSSGYYSTGIKNIVSYKAVSKQMASWMNSYTMWIVRYLTSWYYVKSFFETLVHYGAYDGPIEEYRNTAHCELWCRLYNEHTQEYIEGSLACPEAYKFTADSVLSVIIELLMSHRNVPLRGSLTPSSAFGADFINKLQGVVIYPTTQFHLGNVISPFRRNDDAEIEAELSRENSNTVNSQVEEEEERKRQEENERKRIEEEQELKLKIQAEEETRKRQEDEKKRLEEEEENKRQEQLRKIQQEEEEKRIEIEKQRQEEQEKKRLAEEQERNRLIEEKKQQEEERKRIAEEQEKKRQEEEERKKLEDEQEKKKLADEELKKQQQEEEKKKIAEEQERKRLADEEDKRQQEEKKKLEEEENKRIAEEQEKKRLAVEEEKRQQEERKKLEEEKEKQRIVEEQEKIRQEEEKKKKEEEEVKRQQEEKKRQEEEEKKKIEEDRKRQEEEQKKKIEQELEKKKLEEEQERKRIVDEEEKKRLEEEQEKRRVAEELEKKKKQEEEERKKQEEEEAIRQEEERKKQEQEKKRIEEEQEKKRIEQEVQKKKLEEEKEKQRIAEEQEKKRLEEEEKKKKQLAEEKQQQEEEEKKRVAEEQEKKKQEEEEEKSKKLEEEEKARIETEREKKRRELEEIVRKHKEQKLLEEQQKKLANSITFSVNCKTEQTDQLFVTGNIPILGNWKLADAVPLEKNENENWTKILQIPKDVKNCEYKYVKRNKDTNEEVWEATENRKLTFEENTVTNDKFNLLQ